MLRFSMKPDKICKQILNDCLEMSIDDIKECIKYNEDPKEIWEDDLVELFGSEVLIKNLKKLQKAHNSKNIYNFFLWTSTFNSYLMAVPHCPFVFRWAINGETTILRSFVFGKLQLEKPQ